MRSVMLRAAIGIGLGMALAAAVALYVKQGSGERQKLERLVRAQPLSAIAPDASLHDRQGRVVPLSSYRGRLVFVNFWATWCGPCVAEMPSLVELAKDLDPASIAFVSIAEDDDWAPVDAWLAKTPLPFDVFRDEPPRVENAFQTTSYPTSFLVDRDGKALYRFDGAREWTSPAMRGLFEKIGAKRIATGK